MSEFYEPKDLLPDWGPYSKKYMGISKVVSEALIPGTRFDCVVHPMLANTNQPAPNVTFPSSYHVWEAAADLSYLSYRVELEWKDQVYADVSFSKVDEHTRLIRTEYVNNTDLAQNCVLNYYLAMEYQWKCVVKPACDGSFAWAKFVDYESVEFARPRAWEHLMSDGLHFGEFFDKAFTEGRGFGDRVSDSTVPNAERVSFGEEAGDRVKVTIPLTEPLPSASPSAEYDTMTFRYRTTGVKDAAFQLIVYGTGEAEEPEQVIMFEPLVFPASEELALLSVPVTLDGINRTDKISVALVSEGKGGVELDFAALHKKEFPLTTVAVQPEFVPECIPAGNGWQLSYQGVPETFGFLPLTDKVRIRRIPTGTLEDAVVSRLSQADHTFDEVTRTFTSAFEEKHSDDGFYQNFIVHSIFIPAGERHVEYALIGDGMPGSLSRERAEEIYRKARGKVRPLSYNKEGEKYSFSNRLLQSTLLTNIVYPIYRHGEWIKHHTPGKRWDSLYTWDSGFIGLGLLECEPRLAEYVLDLYLSSPENKDFAFLMHGSPVPVQAYLYLELLQRSGDKTKLLSWYPRLKRYYSFLAGKSEGSSTDPFKSRLTTTFDYFYNCSGMDDLPPQVAMYEQGKRTDCAPALTTSQLIRMAKILRMVAKEQGLAPDVEEYDEDIALRTNALQTYSWDEESGYFGYVVHDKEKNPIGIFKTPEGENLSKGMDGIYPLIAGVCTAEQERKLLGHIFSEREMFSAVGISAVDMSAGYYQENGYWNGNVWFSHQWFIWKTMFDLGRTGEAYRIAERALDSWKKEVDHSYYTFEMLNIATGRGGWFHQFGGLSAPVNVWANAYYKPGTVTCGFELWIHKQSYEEAADTFSITVTNYAKRDVSLLAVTKGRGAVAMEIPAGTRQTTITIRG